MLNWYQYFMLRRICSNMLLLAIPCSYLVCIGLAVMFEKNILLWSIILITLFWLLVYISLTLKEKAIRRAQLHNFQDAEKVFFKQLITLGIIACSHKLVTNLIAKNTDKKNDKERN